jgi:RNA polymerase sigma-70 factor (ECF subfamily)
LGSIFFQTTATKPPPVGRHLLQVIRVDQFTIERARRGDRDAMAALLNGLADVWFRFCVSQLRDAELARDAVQETAVRFMKQLAQFRGESKIESWSLGIALNVIREQRRAAQKNSSMKLAVGVNPRDAAESYSEAETINEDERSQLHDLLNDLPDRQREAIVLRFFEEKSVEETAAMMNCAEGTIKATVHQALRSLKQKLLKRT